MEAKLAEARYEKNPNDAENFRERRGPRLRSE